MTDQERIDSVQRLGYREREARFLVFTALHSGYFLRRQFAQFADLNSGRSVTAFADKLRLLDHARIVRIGRDACLFQLKAGPLYAALGERVRRPRRYKAVAIKAKLMGLDYILAHREDHFLATDDERVDYFRSRLQGDLSCLPKNFTRPPGRAITTQYFGERFPIGLTPSQSAETHQVSFCYIAVGTDPVQRFKFYLRRYASLFQMLDDARLVYVAEDGRDFHGAHLMFERFWRVRRGSMSFNAGPIESVRRYFELRARYEAGTLDQLTTANLQELRRGRDAFAAAEWQELFARWKREGASALMSTLQGEVQAPSATRTLAFATWSSQQNYDLFGTIWRL